MSPVVLRWAPAAVLLLGVVATTTGARTQHVVPLRSPLEAEIPRELLGWPSRDIEVSEAEQRVAGMSTYVMRVYQPAEELAAAEAAARQAAAEAAAAETADADAQTADTSTAGTGAVPGAASNATGAADPLAEDAIAGSDRAEPATAAPAAGPVVLPRWISVYVGYYESQAQGKTIHSPKNCLPGGGWEPLTSSRQAITTPLGEVTVNRYLIANGEAKSLVLYWYQGRGRVEANEYTVKWDLLRDQALLGRSDEALVRIIVPVRTSEAEAYAQAEQVAKELVVHVDRALPPRS